MHVVVNSVFLTGWIMLLRILQRNAKYTIERNEDNSIIYIK